MTNGGHRRDREVDPIKTSRVMQTSDNEACQKVGRRWRRRSGDGGEGDGEGELIRAVGETARDKGDLVKGKA